MNVEAMLNAVVTDVESGNFEAAEAKLDALLAHDWRDPGVCHWVGLFHWWRAWAAEDAGDAQRANRHWNEAIPHLAYALADEEYLAGFRELREQTYRQQFEGERIEQARERAYRCVNDRFQALEERFREGNRDADRTRIQELWDRWRLEVLATRLTRDLGGIPDGALPARCVAAGPAFSARHGLYDLARDYLQELSVAQKSPIEEIIEECMEANSVLEGQVTSRLRREVKYCFSTLCFPFLYRHEGRYGKAMDALGHLMQKSETRAAEDEVRGEAETARAEARRLAMEIRMAVGTEHLERGGPGVKAGLAYWGEALKDADSLEGNQNTLAWQGQLLRIHMQQRVQQRTSVLVSQKQFDEALFLASGFARIVPRDESLGELAAILLQAAHHAFSAGNDEDAMRYLARARIVVPHDRTIKENLLGILGKRVQDLLPSNDHQATAEVCMDIFNLAQDLLRENPEHPLAKRAAGAASYWLQEVLSKVAQDEAQRDLAMLVFFFLKEAVSGGSSAEFGQLNSVRLAKRAQERLKRGDVAEAFYDIDESLRQHPGNAQLQQLYEFIVRFAVDAMCDQGALDHAGEIAQTAFQRLPGSPVVDRCRARVMFRRLDPEKLLSDESEDIATLVAIVENWLGKEERDREQELRTRGGRYAAIVDASQRNERQLKNAGRLLENRRPREALRLLGRASLSGLDEAKAIYLASLCHLQLLNLAEGLEAAEKLVQEFPRLVAGHHVRGRILSLMGRFEEAETELSLCRDADEDDYGLVLELAMNAYRAGRYADAVADLRLARDHGIDAAQTIFIQCIHALRCHNEAALATTIAQIADRHREDPSIAPTIDWFEGKISDEQLLELAVTPQQRCGFRFWLGEKLRAQGNVAEGNALIASCLDTNAVNLYEFEHALAMKNSGQLEPPLDSNPGRSGSRAR